MKIFSNKKYFKLIIIEFSIIAILAMIFIFVNSSFINLAPKCFWLENYNLICPSCGSTRCIINLVNGDFISSFFYNPFLFILIIYLLLLNLLYIINTIFHKKYLKFFYPKWWYVCICTTLFFAHIVVIPF